MSHTKQYHSHFFVCWPCSVYPDHRCTEYDWISGKKITQSGSLERPLERLREYEYIHCTSLGDTRYSVFSCIQGVCLNIPRRVLEACSPLRLCSLRTFHKSRFFPNPWTQTIERTVVCFKMYRKWVNIVVAEAWKHHFPKGAVKIYHVCRIKQSTSICLSVRPFVFPETQTEKHWIFCVYRQLPFQKQFAEDIINRFHVSLLHTPFYSFWFVDRPWDWFLLPPPTNRVDRMSPCTSPRGLFRRNPCTVVPCKSCLCDGFHCPKMYSADSLRRVVSRSVSPKTQRTSVGTQNLAPGSSR